MIVVEYWGNGRRCGLLYWDEIGETPSARGGFSPDELGHHDEPADAFALIVTDQGERRLAGWPHPDDIREVSGTDRPRCHYCRTGEGSSCDCV